MEHAGTHGNASNMNSRCVGNSLQVEDNEVVLMKGSYDCCGCLQEGIGSGVENSLKFMPADRMSMMHAASKDKLNHGSEFCM
jgi:hypothetical protein